MSFNKTFGNTNPLWRHIAPVLAAFGLVVLAVVIARITDLNDRAMLDFGGARAAATAEPANENVFRVRFTDAQGNIHARRIESGWLPPRIPSEGGEIIVAYAPDQPNRFLPAGSSYAPGVLVFVLFLAGLTLVLRVRQQVLASVRAKRDRSTK